MAFALLTLSASLILNLAVLALLKIGLRGDSHTARASAAWGRHQPC